MSDDKKEKVELSIESDASSKDNTVNDNGVFEKFRGFIGTQTTILEEEEENARALKFYEQAQSYSDEEINRLFVKVRRKVDFRLLPILCIAYLLQFLDKLSLNYASSFSMKEDIGISSEQYSWVAAIFNFGYLGFAFPANLLVQKLPIGTYTGVTIFTWSIILIGHIGAKNYGGMLVLRFLLGMLEASISPSIMAITRIFYTEEDQPFRMCCFLSFNGIATMVGALLAFGLGHVNNATIQSWKLIFLVIGLMNFVFSIIFLIFCPNSPSSAKFLSDEEKAILIEKISRNNKGIRDKKLKKYQAYEAMKDPVVWILLISGLGCGVINGGISNFLSSIIKGYGYTGIQAVALQLPTGAIEFVMVFGAGVIAITVKNTRSLLYFILCLPGFLAIIILHVVDLKSKSAIAGTFFFYTIGGPVILNWVCINSIGGDTKRTCAAGAWFALYAAGNIIGSVIMGISTAPRYTKGMIGFMTCYAAMIVLNGVYFLILKRRNRLRNIEQGGYTEEIAQQAIIDGYKGYTDFENRGYRYPL